MTSPPSNFPSAAYMRFERERRMACILAEETLRERLGMPELRITTFDVAVARALRAWESYERGRHWPWPTLIGEGREDDPAAFEAALWHGDELCGLAHGMGGDRVCAVEFMEGSPAPKHPLRGHVLAAVVEIAFGYTVILGRPELRLIRPRPHVVERVQARDPTIELVPAAGSTPHYLRILV